MDFPRAFWVWLVYQFYKASFSSKIYLHSKRWLWGAGDGDSGGRDGQTKKG